jgi:hypothetical protein
MAATMATRRASGSRSHLVCVAPRTVLARVSGRRTGAAAGGTDVLVVRLDALAAGAAGSGAAATAAAALARH